MDKLLEPLKIKLSQPEIAHIYKAITVIDVYYANLRYQSPAAAVMATLVRFNIQSLRKVFRDRPVTQKPKDYTLKININEVLILRQLAAEYVAEGNDPYGLMIFNKILGEFDKFFAPFKSKIITDIKQTYC